ncbi:3-galactosyl-N-acetylglucosaminide 4-alpha-L-fucosyltransferase FUT3-like [Mya arenaria]|uniref:3-galactosyl-N-acetylglucosaminide 4-alpha-L-fucosyltransferase FUT3-like n=1 Tax=Mya arenaria TaxID=6604 RepID=UPI0022E4CEC9|nr:3-galactosyl-N-acetylglucosaminide 4-alpha-L-fucosyltransferase FUT3-like [Mya arenaria]
MVFSIRVSVIKNAPNALKLFAVLQLVLVVAVLQLRVLVSPDMTVHDDRHVVLWYNPSIYLQNRPTALARSFDACPAAHCRLTFDLEEAARAKAVIFDGRRIAHHYRNFSRPYGQLWVWWANEPPSKYYETGEGWEEFSGEFNLTMTYHRRSDVYVPYGKLVPKSPPEPKDFAAVAENKTRSVLWVASNCHTFSWREQYVKELQKYIDVDIYGRCSPNMKPWTCGQRHYHDQCFSKLNAYKFYLAFENALCEDYITEKFFENYDYDTVMVARGGVDANYKEIIPEDVYVDANDFPNPKALATHLKSLIDDVPRYANMLEKKNVFKNMPYHLIYQSALCQLCDKISYPDMFEVSRYKSIRDTFHESQFCRHPTDLTKKYR